TRWTSGNIHESSQPSTCRLAFSEPILANPGPSTFGHGRRVLDRCAFVDQHYRNSIAHRIANTARDADQSPKILCVHLNRTLAFRKAEYLRRPELIDTSGTGSLSGGGAANNSCVRP